MSRVGRAPVFLSKDVQVNITPKNEVVVKGAKTSLTIPMRSDIKAKVADGKVVLSMEGEDTTASAFFGLYRALIQNAVTGVSKGWQKSLDLNGVGYRAAVSGKKLELTLGYSHPVFFNIPQGIEITVDKQTKIIVNGASREQVGQVAAKIRSFRPPEPYLGKGIKYTDEHIRRKAGKSAAK
jgi:large subunit ribosomal protein L6